MGRFHWGQAVENRVEQYVGQHARHSRNDVLHEQRKAVVRLGRRNGVENLIGGVGCCHEERLRMLIADCWGVDETRMNASDLREF